MRPAQARSPRPAGRRSRAWSWRRPITELHVHRGSVLDQHVGSAVRDHRGDPGSVFECAAAYGVRAAGDILGLVAAHFATVLDAAHGNGLTVRTGVGLARAGI